MSRRNRLQNGLRLAPLTQSLPACLRVVREAATAIDYRHLLVLSGLFALSITAKAAQTGESAAVPRFEPATCPKIQGVEWLAAADCGYLTVPEDRSRPNGRTIQLMVARHRAQSPEKRPDPILYLEGGPGDIAPLEIDAI